MEQREFLSLTKDSDGIYIGPVKDHISSQVQVNLAAVPVVLRNIFCHCQHAGACGLVQVVFILDLNGSITGEWDKVKLRRAIPSQPQKPLGKGHIPHTLNTAGGSAVEGEGVVGSHIGETSGVGSKGCNYSWDCRGYQYTYKFCSHLSS